MVWPQHLLATPPKVRIPCAYSLRVYRPEDGSKFYGLMKSAGWSHWNDKVLQPWLARMLKDGWFLVTHRQSQKIVASCMALTSLVYPKGGELGWLAGDPAHSGKGVGLAASAAVTAKFVEERCSNIHLNTDDYRLAALKIYLKLGYVPLLCGPEMLDRWRKICHELLWPFAPDTWPSYGTAG